MDRILLFIKVPPPVTGATLMNKRVYDSEMLRDNFNIRSILISYMSDLNEMGKWKINKVIKFINILIKLFNELILFKPQFVYFQISPHRIAFYRDLIYLTIIKIFNVKIVYHLRGKGIKEHVKIKWKRKIYTYAFKRSDIICVSHLLTYDIEDIFKGKIYIVNNGIPDIEKKYLTKSKISQSDTVKILFLSNLIKSKGILNFLESLKLLSEKGYQFSANIIGAEADLCSNDLQSIIINNNLTNKVIYLGSEYGKGKYEILAKSDVLVFPTKNDIWGNVILEAMQFSIPVIATVEGAIPEIIDDRVTGFLVDKDSPDQIADKLEILIKNPKLRELMGKAGRKKYEKKYTFQKFEENMMNVFKDVLININGA